MTNIEAKRERDLEAMRRRDYQRMRREFWALKVEQANNVIPFKKGFSHV